MAWWVSPAAVAAQTAARASARASELGVIAIDPLVRECLTRAQHLPRADQTHPQPPHAGLAPGGPLPQQRKQLREVAPPHQGRVGQPRARGPTRPWCGGATRSEEHTAEIQSRQYPVCRPLLEKK